ncbi:LOW QUALITY PROTEIN: testis-specific Y-encoded-like protein 1 [Bos indicus x Bos taurus]|uniref:LOW QUALITY PROTEIN: testis-specific Y-encoded-like protein 1 n=1 Tax=Bos indicus x Bos taurus TaxID=30522 RepID=UPI000F7D408B|nr:LOW QUALITY PROTEIN: testis-specific Y-encoded-like protein 1 [Bos indicus x Bos taurus]
MSSPDGGERTPLLETHSLATSDCAAGAPDPSRCLKTEASQVMAERGEGYFEAVTLPPPQLPEEEDAPPAAPPDPGCASTFQIRAGGDGGYVAPEARLEPAPPTEGLEMASGSLATDNSLGNGRQPGEPLGLSQEKPLETCGAENLGSDLMAEAKAEEVKTQDGPVFSVAVDEEVVGKEGAKEEEAMEQGMEVEERPVGEEIEIVENRVVEEAGHRPLRMDLHMNPLEAIQLELDTVNAQADRAFQQLEHKFGWMHRHYLEPRNYIIQNIPGFWVTAFRNHPQLSPMIRGQDAEMLRYITNLEVKELRHPRTGCKFKFFFRRNPYFRNQLIVKEYEVRASGRVVSLSTPIIWRRGHEPQSFIRRNQEVVCNFFTWFSDHSLPESDRIAEIIKEDLWPDPLQYYLLREGVRRARRRPVREPVEIPRPFGFQSG